MSFGLRNDVIPSPTVGTSQIRAIAISPMWIGERVRKRTKRSLRVCALMRNGLFDGRHQATTFSLRNRRTLRTMTGAMMTNMITATAAP